MNEDNNTGVVDQTVESHRQLARAESLPSEVMLLKMENEQIFSIARAKPRDYAQIIKQLQSIIDAYPAAADQAIYSKPVGTVIIIVCGACGHKYEVSYIPKKGVECPKDGCGSPAIASQKKIKKFAEGLSIRAAETIRSVFGFTRLTTTMEVLPDERVLVQGMFVDYVAGNVTGDGRVVSPFYKSRWGSMERHPEDRFLNVVVKSEKAKLRRDIILDSIDNSVKRAFWDACEKKLQLALTPENEKKIIDYFAMKGIDLSKLEKLVGRPKSFGWTVADATQLGKIKNALENEETTVAELLADLEEKPQAPSGPISPADLANPKEATPPTPASTPTGQAASGDKEPLPSSTTPRGSETPAPVSSETMADVAKASNKKDHGPDILDLPAAQPRPGNGARRKATEIG